MAARITQTPPDIIAITETLPKADCEITPEVELNIQGYDLLLSQHNTRGTALYVRESIPHRQHDLTQTEYNDHIWAVIEPQPGTKILLGCMYRSPNSTSENNQKLIDILSQACNAPKTHLLVLGDFNFKEIDWNLGIAKCSEIHPASSFLDAVSENYLIQHVDQPTRYREGQNPSLLDLVLTDKENMIEDLELEAPLGKSDHVVLKMQFLVAPPDTTKQEHFKYQKGDYEGMREEIGKVNWNDLLQDKSVDEAWISVEETVGKAMLKYIPKAKGGNSSRKLWMTKETDDAILAKHRAWNKFNKTKNPDDQTLAKEAGNDSSRTIKQAKVVFERLLVSNLKTNPKGFWSYVASKTTVKSGIGDLINENGETISEDKEKAKLLNQFFASVFTQENTTDIPTIAPQTDQLLTDLDITTKKVQEHLDNILESKSPGPDGMHSKVIRELKDELATPFTQIFKQSMEVSELPINWKRANVIPIFKKGQKSKPGNYRPVSLTVIACKIMEKLVRDEIIDHMTQNGLLTDAQYGFRSGRSCALQLLEVLEDWTAQIDAGLPVDCIYLDYKKAFDSVPHERLLLKMQAHGIQGNIGNWVRQFLTGRKQRVAVNGQTSEWMDVTSGIPQGSILGPTLFLIFINDLPNIAISTTKLFADDTKLYRPIASHDDRQILQEDIDKLWEWSEKWQLPFNADKCKIIHYGKNNPRYEYKIGPQGSQSSLAVDTTEKDLGVKFDEDLKFSTHIAEVASRARRIMGLIVHSFETLDKQLFLTLYKSKVRPIVEYGCTVFAPLFKKDVIILEKVQRKATKCLKELRDKPYPDRLRYLNLPTLVYRRERTDMIQVFKIVKGIEDTDSTKFFELAEETGSNTRGHKLKIRKKQSSTNLRSNTFSNRVVNDWNSLPEEAVNCCTVNQFKTCLEEAWKDRPSKYIPY